MNFRSPIYATALALALLISGLSAGALTGHAAAGRATNPYDRLALFSRILTIIEQDYVEEISEEQLLQAAIDGMVDELDPHSRWMSPDEYRQLLDETKGQYEGIGVEVRSDPRGVVITSILPNSPASRSDLQDKDIIIGVNDQPLEGLDINTISNMLQGPRGSTLTLTIVRNGDDEPFKVETMRDRVDILAVRTMAMPGNIAYARLYQFQQGCAKELRIQVDELRKNGATEGLILDLRDNPGGLLPEAIAVTDLFLDQGLLVSTQGRVEGEIEHLATEGGFPKDMPLVILINGRSASASEIVAGALQDTNRGTLVGRATYGKGSVQTLYENRDDSALKMTIGRYFTPSGQPVAAKEGRAPDVIVRLPNPPTDAQRLREALHVITSIDDEKKAELIAMVDDLDLKKTREPDTPWDGPLSQRLVNDTQLKYAHDLLSGRIDPK